MKPQPTLLSNSLAKKRPKILLAVASVLALALSGCAGGAGGNNSAEADDATGFEFGASQAEVEDAIADLDPITITYQPSAASPDSSMAAFGNSFKEIVEERSGGKIEVEMVYGQGIAGYSEVHDALADGRLDMAYTLPIYDPEEFPAFNDTASVMAALPSSPFEQELVTYAVGTELGWNNEKLLQEYKEKNLYPLTPLAARGIFYSVCNENTTSRDDWNGTQTRVGSSAQENQVRALGGSAVSIEYAETYEALQRGTIDCTMFQLVAAVEGGFLEVAPHIGHTTDNTFSSAPGAVLAGSSFDNLPLPYQQLIFDANMLAASDGMEAVMEAKVEAVQQAKEAGGDLLAIEDDLIVELEDNLDSLVEDATANGNVDGNVLETIDDFQTQWQEEFQTLGYVDEGSLADLDEWYELDTDFEPYGTTVVEQGSALQHRPS